MTLELTLIKTQTPLTPVGSFLERKRYEVQSDQEVSAAVIKFIGDCMDVISPMISDKTFVQGLQNISTLSAEDLCCMKSMLSQYGLDIFTWCVAETEVNGDALPADSYEYNIVDHLQSMTDSQKMCTKIVMPTESLSYSRLFEKIQEIYGLYSPEKELFAGSPNPYNNLLRALKTIEAPMGSVSTSFVSQLNALLGYLGKEIYVVTAE